MKRQKKRRVESDEVKVKWGKCEAAGDAHRAFAQMDGARVMPSRQNSARQPQPPTHRFRCVTNLRKLGAPK